MKEKIKKNWKKNSASKCKRVASLKPTTSPIKALKEVMGYHIPQTTAPRDSLARKKKKLQKFSFHDQRWPIGVSEWCILGGACVPHQQVLWSLIGASLDRIIHFPTQSDPPGVLQM